MPKLHSETFGAGDQTWLGSNHGLYNAPTFILDAAAFRAIQTEKGKVPSGYPVTVAASGKLAPYTGAEEVAGHILFDQVASKGDVAVPVMNHGTVIAGRVPYTGFTAPTAAPNGLNYL